MNEEGRKGLFCVLFRFFFNRCKDDLSQRENGPLGRIGKGEVGTPVPAGGTILAAGKDSQRQWRAAMSSHGCLGDLACDPSFSALVFSSVQWEGVNYSYRQQH